MRPTLLVLAPVLAALALGCADRSKKIEEAQKKRDAEKKAQQEAAEAKRKAAAPKVEEAELEPFWGDPAYIRISTGRPCPEGLWALFSGAPGETEAERAANEKKREAYVAKLRGATFVTVLAHGGGLTLRKYNKKKKRITVEVDGLVECFDTLGLISAAWGEPAKPFRPKAPDDDEEELQAPQAVWRAQPLHFSLPFANAAEAKVFTEREGVGTAARLVYTLGKVDVDKKLAKTARPDGVGGVKDDTLDWGAGRLVHVNLLGVRVSTGHEKVELVVQKNEPKKQ